MPNYYTWTIGCQMNKAESRKAADFLEILGYKATDNLKKANLVLLNTCVVRQSAESKVLGMLGYLKGLKSQRPDLSILITGCFVDSNIEELKKTFPYIDLFFKPSDYTNMVNWAKKQALAVHVTPVSSNVSRNVDVAAFVPIIQGCNNFCSYCIVPYRRGREKSRPLNEVVCDVRELVHLGTKEVTLLGQNVNSYGHDLPAHHCLSDLLIELNNIAELSRIRFLTNHPKDMSQKLLHTMATLDKVCRHINLPLQSGNDHILKAMGRGYTAEQYRQLVARIRENIHEVALTTDVIVGFPGESTQHFKQTLEILEDIRFDTVHVAAYSPRSGTAAARKFEDNISPEVKKERLNQVEEMQAKIASDINSELIGRTMEVLIEGKKGDKWYGRTSSNKLVFLKSNDNCLGKLVGVTILKTSPWALQAYLALG
jgi:tRNA-2-methylthio-N6-dimethylallyladenosine synthase